SISSNHQNSHESYPTVSSPSIQLSSHSSTSRKMPTESHCKSPENMAPAQPESPTEPASATSGIVGTDDISVAKEEGHSADEVKQDYPPVSNKFPATAGKFPQRRVVPFEIASQTNTNTRRGRHERRAQSNRVAKKQVTLNNLPYLTAKLKGILEDDPGRGGSGKGTGSNRLEKSYHLLDSSRGPEDPNGVDRYITAFNQAKALKEEEEMARKRGHGNCHCGGSHSEGTGNKDNVPGCRQSSPPVEEPGEVHDS
ncbi:hypothetical protein V8F20_005059, partial [Naviculisporaceae sp. PSN 640]